MIKSPRKWIEKNWKSFDLFAIHIESVSKEEADKILNDLNGAEYKITDLQKKETKKMYGVYSGYPGGLKQKALWQIRQENPNEIIRHAVWGMLPTNKLRDRLVTRLFIYPDENHPYKDKFHI